MSAVKTIGIIGGGQLGLMIIEQAHLLGARTICLDPAEDAPAFKISDERSGENHGRCVCARRRLLHYEAV